MCTLMHMCTMCYLALLTSLGHSSCRRPSLALLLQCAPDLCLSSTHHTVFRLTFSLFASAQACKVLVAIYILVPAQA